METLALLMEFPRAKSETGTSKGLIGTDNPGRRAQNHQVFFNGNLFLGKSVGPAVGGNQHNPDSSHILGQFLYGGPWFLRLQAVKAE